MHHPSACIDCVRFTRCYNTQTALARICVVLCWMEIPVCPRGPDSALASHIRIHGWCWDDEVLVNVVGTLAAEDISDPVDLHGVDMSDVSGTEEWPPGVKDFLAKLCQVLSVIAPLRNKMCYAWQAAPHVNRKRDETCMTVLQAPCAKAARTCSRLEHVAGLDKAQVTLLNLDGVRPLEALELLERNLPSDEGAREHWKSCARIAAVMGSCPRSLASFKSGLKHWIKFIEVIYGKDHAHVHALPPKLEDILVWSNTFRCTL